MSRDKMIPIRFTEEELERLRPAAARAGLGLGPWLRMLGLREAAAPSPAPPRRPSSTRRRA